MSSVPAAKQILKKNKEARAAFVSQSHRKSPLRSARDSNYFKKQNVIRVPSRRSDTRSERGRSISRGRDSRGRDPSGDSGVKESAPIIITKDDQFMYKAPSSIHETVVQTLRREKDGLTLALKAQRDITDSLGSKM